MPGELSGVWMERGAWGLVALFVVLVLTGQLVPRRYLRDWQRAYFESERQRQALIESQQVTQHVLRAIPDAMPGEDNSP